MRTYCRAEMKFIDVTALADASVTTDDNQGIGSIELFAEQTEQKSYGTFELNQFVLDGSKSVLTENRKTLHFGMMRYRRKIVLLKQILRLQSRSKSSTRPQRSHFILKMSHQQS